MGAALTGFGVAEFPVSGAMPGLLVVRSECVMFVWLTLTDYRAPRNQKSAGRGCGCRRLVCVCVCFFVCARTWVYGGLCCLCACVYPTTQTVKAVQDRFSLSKSFLLGGRRCVRVAPGVCVCVRVCVERRACVVRCYDVFCVLRGDLCCVACCVLHGATLPLSVFVFVG